MSDAQSRSPSRRDRTLKLYLADVPTGQTDAGWRKRRIGDGGAA